MKDEIVKIFNYVYVRELPGEQIPEVTDDLVLLESGLDSLGFAMFVVELETQLGFDPFTIADEAYYPVTFGEFVSFYEKYQPA